MLYLSESPKHGKSYSVGFDLDRQPLHQTWEISGAFLLPSLKCFFIVTTLTALLLMGIVSPRPKTQPAVYIVTCTSGLGSCQVVCQEQEFWAYEDKSLFFYCLNRG